jgi:hypothetical protein
MSILVRIEILTSHSKMWSNATYYQESVGIRKGVLPYQIVALFQDRAGAAGEYVRNEGAVIV